MHSLQQAYPNECLTSFGTGEFLCTSSGELAREMDGTIPERLCFLDHLGYGTIGHSASGNSLSATEFADILIAQLELVKTHNNGRVPIRDVDILGCEGGLRWLDSQGVLHENFAEIVARKLAEAGYAQIKVHALTPEFIGDPEVTHTYLYGGGPIGQPFSFYGFTNEGLTAINAAGEELQEAQQTWYQLQSQKYTNYAMLTALRSIFPRTPEQHNDYVNALIWQVKVVPILEIQYQFALESATAKYLETRAEHSRPKDGAIKDLRQALDDPRNLFDPLEQISLEQEKLIEEEQDCLRAGLDVLCQQIRAIKDFDFTLSTDPLNPIVSLRIFFNIKREADTFVAAIQAKDPSLCSDATLTLTPDFEGYVVECNPSLVRENPLLNEIIAHYLDSETQRTNEIYQRQLLLADALSHNFIVISPPSFDPFQISIPDELGYLCIKKYLEENEIVFESSYKTEGMIEISDELFLQKQAVQQLIDFLSSIKEWTQKAAEIREDRIQEQLTVLMPKINLLRGEIPTIQAVAFDYSADPLQPIKGIKCLFNTKQDANHFVAVIKAREPYARVKVVPVPGGGLSVRSDLFISNSFEGDYPELASPPIPQTAAMAEKPAATRPSFFTYSADAEQLQNTILDQFREQLIEKIDSGAIQTAEDLAKEIDQIKNSSEYQELKTTGNGALDFENLINEIRTDESFLLLAKSSRFL
ncbi:hypothetical protein [Legionella massiliensis]|nr:hypothetical protein [Legionella massiliensis]